MKNFDELYDSSYFQRRNYNDKKRIQSFKDEKNFIVQHVSLSGAICDVGCSTGEFLSTISWVGPKYGMEVNADAIEMSKASGIEFRKNILTEIDYFDTVVFRGTIQHIPNPFEYIIKSYSALKKGGHIVFLATPNANSLVNKIFNTLPALDPKLNFYIPLDINLCKILENCGFEIKEINYPYLISPYSNFITDHVKLFLYFLFNKKPDFAFWRNMMNIVAVKK